MARRTAKSKAWEWCSKYIRMRDAVEYHKNHPEQDFGWVECCTCGRLIRAFKNCDAGHWIERGRGGMSGVYFDERNIHAQCKNCNGGFYAGKNIRAEVDKSYDQFMLRKYGQEVIDQLNWLDKNQSYRGKIRAIGEMYKEMYNDIQKRHT